jgi:hypothetical protein
MKQEMKRETDHHNLMVAAASGVNNMSTQAPY